MGIEYIIAICLIAGAFAIRAFTGMFTAEYDAALATRRLVNASRRRAEAKLRARLEEFHEGAARDAA